MRKTQKCHHSLRKCKLQICGRRTKIEIDVQSQSSSIQVTITMGHEADAEDTFTKKEQIEKTDTEFPGARCC